MTPTTKEIEEAVKYVTHELELSKIIKDNPIVMVDKKHINFLLSLAQEYLLVKGMPEEYTDYEQCCVGNHTDKNCIKNVVSKAKFEEHNKILHFCKLAAIKAVPSEGELGGMDKEKLLKYLIEEAYAYSLATAIHKLYLEKLGVKND